MNNVVHQHSNIFSAQLQVYHLRSVALDIVDPIDPISNMHNRQAIYSQFEGFVRLCKTSCVNSIFKRKQYCKLVHM